MKSSLLKCKLREMGRAVAQAHLQRPATSGPWLRGLPIVDELRAVEPKHGRTWSSQFFDYINRSRAAGNGSRGQAIRSKCAEVTDEVTGNIL